MVRFNPRACVRRDRRNHMGHHIIDCFNPRACVRRDASFLAQNLRLRLFQSTRLHEARRSSSQDLPILRRFNPRACVRRDGRLYDARVEDFLVSIHAPA